MAGEFSVSLSLVVVGSRAHSGCGDDEWRARDKRMYRQYLHFLDQTMKKSDGRTTSYVFSKGIFVIVVVSKGIHCCFGRSYSGWSLFRCSVFSVQCSALSSFINHRSTDLRSQNVFGLRASWPRLLRVGQMIN